MARHSILVAILVLAAPVIAGCVGGKAADADEPASSAVIVGGDEVTDGGSVKGSVVDESIAPIPNAQVAILSLGAVAVTDPAGGFEFQNVPAGTHQIVAAALGYESIAKSVDVAAGEATTLSLTLVQIPLLGVQWLEVIGPIPGFVNCTFGTPIVTGICSPPMNLAGNEKSSFTYKMHNETTHFAGEIRWTQASAGTSKFLGLTFSYNGRPATHWWCFGSGPPSSVKWLFTMEDGACTTTGRAQQQIPNGQPKKPNETMTLQSFVTIPFTQVGNAEDPLPAHVALQQKVEVIFSIFQNYEAVPEDYTAFLDS